MSEAKPSRSPKLYAGSDDFRRVFREETASLYRLAFLLTADHEKGERGFQRLGTLMGTADDHSKRRTSHQPRPDGGISPFEFLEWWHNAGS
jgi:hypothetical protein